MSRVNVLYLAPWVDYGGTDKGTIDWFKHLDRDRFRVSLMTTQPSANRRLAEVLPYADEVWALPELMAGKDFPGMVCDFIHHRGVDVLHIMNSRLGYNLLPDLPLLPRPPLVVVQLHVEEQDKSGYVRYVTTRYGNLVDGFSVTSEHLAQAVIGYDVPRSKTHVIYTGVDADAEFNPERVEPLELERGPFHILYPGRIEEQKDPLLMVEVATELRDSGADFRMHVVGEGRLEPDVRRLVSERGLDPLFAFHPPTPEIGRWYKACDALLMTSVFEGVPYVVFEAMAMRLPIVAPALPGNVELMADVAGSVIEPRDDVAAYAAALRRLIDDPSARERIGAAARERVRERFSLQLMARQHERLYEDLLAAKPRGAAPSLNGRVDPPQPLRFRERPSRGRPLVSVVVPCFNHGRYLPETLASIREQDYPAIEVIVVDDASTEPDTVEELDRLERAGEVRVVRMERNSGPSAARNAGIAAASGRYVLPVDSDNLLLPGAVERLVEQIQGAGEQVGFIYPSVQYFGNRNDLFQAPDYNLYNLLRGNFCDTCSLIDRDVFDAGLRYPEDIVVGHEDWDFVVGLGARDVRGEPARGKTMMLRKRGFNRSDEVEYGSAPFHKVIEGRHPELYSSAVDIKARWSPALSIVVLDSIEPGASEARELSDLLDRQSCTDVEVVVRSKLPWEPPMRGPAIRRVPASLEPALGAGLDAALGRWVMVTRGVRHLLSDPGFVEKVLRVFHGLHPELGAIALTDAGEAGRFPLRLLGPDDGVELAPHAVAWRVDEPRLLSDETTLVRGREIDSVARAVARVLPMQWRHAPARIYPARVDGSSEGVRLAPLEPSRPSARAEREMRMTRPPAIPVVKPGTIRRWKLTAAWVPPETEFLCRHKSRLGAARMLTNDPDPPAGYELEYQLGSINRFAVPGTARLVQVPGPNYELRPREEPPVDEGGVRTLGYVEQAPLPLLESLRLAYHPDSAQNVLVLGESDPLMDRVELLGTLGWIEPFPIEPRFPPHVEIPFGGLVGLVRALDRGRRRHVYGIGELPAGSELVGELGALLEDPLAGSVPVWLTSGCMLVTDRYEPHHSRPPLARAARWTAAPLAWGAARAGVRAMARRAAAVPLELGRPEAAGSRTSKRPLGYLSGEETATMRVPLYAARHPVTGDQLLTRQPLEASDMGYVDTVLLGYLSSQAPLTGETKLRRVPVPWASRFGLAVRKR